MKVLAELLKPTILVGRKSILVSKTTLIWKTWVNMILKRMTGSKHKSYHAAMVEYISTFAALVLGLSLITPSTPNTTARIFKCRNFNLANYFPGIL